MPPTFAGRQDDAIDTKRVELTKQFPGRYGKDLLGQSVNVQTAANICPKRRGW